MSVCDGERFLREAVESILSQSFSDLELVVVDDGSTDSTPDILADYASRDSRVRFHSQANRGSAAALNLGFSLARAALVARLDADDVATTDRLQRQHRFLSANPAVALVGGQAIFMNEEGQEFARVTYPLSDHEIREAFATTTPFVHSAVMLRKAVAREIGGYRPIVDPAEDLDLWLRIADRHKLANLPEPVVKYRMHPSQASVQKQEGQALRSLAARTAARLRAAGDPDPLDGAERIDEQFLLSHGASIEEIDAAVVDSAVWLAKTMDRAGYAEAAGALFSIAYARARSGSDSPALVASVHRAVGRRHAERGNRFRAKLKAAQAAVAERA
jgi:glycosyltransferase involved in cell wall biosynthesis